MEFAAEKCMVLRITRKHKKIILQKRLEIHNHVLEAVDSAKYLGIIFDSKLYFNHHIQDITKKANNTRQFQQRTLSRCDRAIKEVCYKTYVRPTLEYASTVLDPHKGNKSQANLLEPAQNKAARFVMFDWSWSSSVTGIKSTLQWESLQERRARARVVIFHKIQYSLVAILITLFQHTPSIITTRGALKKFVVPFCRTQAYKNTFIPTAPVLWNSLPPSVATVTDPDSFRRSLTPCGEFQCLAVTLPYLFLNRTALALFLSSFFQHYFPLFAPLCWRHEVATICLRHLATIRTDTDMQTHGVLLSYKPAIPLERNLRQPHLAFLTHCSEVNWPHL